LQKNRRIKEKELNQKRRAAIGNDTAIDRPAKLRKTRSEEVTEDSNKENRQPDLLTQEVTEGTRICTGYTMVKTNEEGAPSKNKKGDAVIKLEYTQFCPEAFHDLVRDKEKSKKTIIDMNKVIAEQKRYNDSYQRDIIAGRIEYNQLKSQHNGFVTLCSQGGTTSEAKRKKLEADSYGYLNKKIKELEDENKRLKNKVNDLQASKPVNPSKEMRAKNTMLEKELLVLQRQHKQLEKDHEELRQSDTHRELSELKDKLEEDQSRDRALDEQINDELEGRKNQIEQLQSVVEKLHQQNQKLQDQQNQNVQDGDLEGSRSDDLEGRKNRIEALESVIAKLQLQIVSLEEGELSKDDRIKVLNGIIAKDKAMIEKLRKELTEAQQLLSEGDKLVTHVMSKQVQNDVRDWVQTVGWRKWKFVMNGHLRDYTDTCYADIAGKLGINNNEEMEEYYISEQDFHRTYGTYFKQCLSTKRQSTQSQMMKPCLGTCHSNIPDIQRTYAKTKRNLTQFLS
jgi:hypothetical protein